MENQVSSKFENVKCYVVCRRLFNKNLTVTSILKELDCLFEIKPNRVLFENWLEINRQVKYYKENKEANAKLKFELDFSHSDIVLKIQFYALCRYQLRENVENIFKELKHLFGAKAPTFKDLECWIASYWRGDEIEQNLETVENDSGMEIIELDTKSVQKNDKEEVTVEIIDCPNIINVKKVNSSDIEILKDENLILKDEIKKAKETIEGYVLKFQEFQTCLLKEREQKEQEIKEIKSNYDNSMAFISDTMKCVEVFRQENNSYQTNEMKLNKIIVELNNDLFELKRKYKTLKEGYEQIVNNFETEKSKSLALQATLEDQLNQRIQCFISNPLEIKKEENKPKIKKKSKAFKKALEELKIKEQQIDTLNTQFNDLKKSFNNLEDNYTKIFEEKKDLEKKLTKMYSKLERKKEKLKTFYINKNLQE